MLKVADGSSVVKLEIPPNIYSLFNTSYAVECLCVYICRLLSLLSIVTIQVINMSCSLFSNPVTMTDADLVSKFKQVNALMVLIILPSIS